MSSGPRSPTTVLKSGRSTAERISSLYLYQRPPAVTCHAFGERVADFAVHGHLATVVLLDGEVLEIVRAAPRSPTPTLTRYSLYSRRELATRAVALQPVVERTRDPLERAGRLRDEAEFLVEGLVELVFAREGRECREGFVAVGQRVEQIRLIALAVLA